MTEILNELRTSLNERKRAVLATIINTEGSVYRREGARCVIYEDGTIRGILSGGCVEKDLLEYANGVLRQGLPQTIDYDFRSEEDRVWGLNLGCNGALKIWLQPFDPARDFVAAGRLVDEFERRNTCQKGYKAGVVMQSADMHRVGIGELVDMPTDSPVGIQAWLIQDVEVQVFVESILPNDHLVIFGAGPDVAPLAQIAKWMDWHVTIVDHREDWANPERFPETDQILLIDRKDYATVPVFADSCIVIMTHNFDLDRIILQRVLQQDAPYIGILGPGRRTQRLLQELAIRDAWSNLHSPIGLDIGSESPNEIALSIMSEILCRKNNRTGGFLKDKSGSIH